MARYIAPVARYRACKHSWRIWEEPLVAACGLRPVAALLRLRHTSTTEVPQLTVLYSCAIGTR